MDGWKKEIERQKERREEREAREGMKWLILFIQFTPPPHTHTTFSSKALLCSLNLWICFCLFYFCLFIFYKSVKSYGVFLSPLDCLTYIITSRFIRIVTNGKISCFWQLSRILLCVCVHMHICIPYLLYPFIGWYRLRLFSYLSCYKQCHNEHSGTYLF